MNLSMKLEGFLDFDEGFKEFEGFRDFDEIYGFKVLIYHPPLF